METTRVKIIYDDRPIPELDDVLKLLALTVRGRLVKTDYLDGSTRLYFTIPGGVDIGSVAGQFVERAMDTIEEFGLDPQYGIW